MWVFDEIHKYRRWRSFLKGLYDRPGLDKRILVTGSARLDFYRHGGDALQGRYHYLRLHPFTMAELGLGTHQELQKLLDLGGLPGTVSLGLEDRSQEMVERVSNPIDSRIRFLPRARPRSRPPRASHVAPTRSRRQPSVHQRASRRSRCEPQDGQQMAGHLRTPLRSRRFQPSRPGLPDRSVSWRSAPSRGTRPAQEASDIWRSISLAFLARPRSRRFMCFGAYSNSWSAVASWACASSRCSARPR